MSTRRDPRSKHNGHVRNASLFSAEKSVTPHRPLRSRVASTPCATSSAAFASRRLSLSVLVNSANNLTSPVTTRGEMNSSRFRSSSVKPSRAVDQQHHAVRFRRTSRYCAITAAIVASLCAPRPRSHSQVESAKNASGLEPRSQLEQIDVLGAARRFRCKGQALLLRQRVDRRRFASIGAADEGNFRQFDCGQLVKLACGRQRSVRCAPMPARLFVLRCRYRCGAVDGPRLVRSSDDAQSRHCKIAGFAPKKLTRLRHAHEVLCFLSAWPVDGRHVGVRGRCPGCREARSGPRPGHRDAGLRRLPHHRWISRQPGEPDPAGPASRIHRQATRRVQDRQARQPDHEGIRSGTE